jgi:threonine/homoserine/homoserine lactone efflux protein
MDYSLFFRGLVIGFSIAAPVGPIGVLCIRRTFADGQVSGLVSGLGAATADAFYGCVAGFGLTFISSFLVGQKMWLSLFGGLFLLYLGVKTLLSQPAEKEATINQSGLLSSYFSIFLLTLTNPLTILSFAAIFAGLGLASAAGSYTSAVILVLGVFLGSATWWFLLSGGVGLLRDRFNTQGLLWVNRVSGLIITIFGIIALTNLMGSWN